MSGEYKQLMRIGHTLAFVELHGAIVVVLVLEVPVGPGAESNGYGSVTASSVKFGISTVASSESAAPADRVRHCIRTI